MALPEFIERLNVPVPPVAENAVVESARLNVVLIFEPPLTTTGPFT